MGRSVSDFQKTFTTSLRKAKLLKIHNVCLLLLPIWYFRKVKVRLFASIGLERNDQITWFAIVNKVKES